MRRMDVVDVYEWKILVVLADDYRASKVNMDPLKLFIHRTIVTVI